MSVNVFTHTAMLLFRPNLHSQQQLLSDKREEKRKNKVHPCNVPVWTSDDFKKYNKRPNILSYVLPSLHIN